MRILPYENTELPIEIYSTGWEAELFLNGKSLGRKRLTEFQAQFNVTYQPGELKVISYDVKGGKIGESSVVTADRQKILTVEVENNKLRKNGEDLSYIDIALTDANGVIRNLEDTYVTVTLNGVGTLAGLGTGNPRPEDRYDGNRCMTYQSRVQAVIRSGYEEGLIQVNLSAEGYPDKNVTIQVG